jgi:Na+-exporting ATPase
MSTVWQFIPNSDQEKPEEYDLLLCTFPSTLIFGRPTIMQPDMKGAVEKVLDRCSYIGIGETRRAITHEDRDNLTGHINTLADEGLRILCFAGTKLPYSKKGSIKTTDRADLEKDCGVLGLVGI